MSPTERCYFNPIWSGQRRITCCGRCVLVPDGDGKAKVIVSTREERSVGETADCSVRSVEPCNEEEANGTSENGQVTL